jgi:hypothetical protein
VAFVLASLGGELRHHILVSTFAMFYALSLIMFVNVHPIF